MKALIFVQNVMNKYHIKDFVIGVVLITAMLFITLSLVYYIGMYLEQLLIGIFGNIAPYAVEWGIECIGGFIVEKTYKKKVSKTIRLIRNRGSTY